MYTITITHWSTGVRTIEVSNSLPTIFVREDGYKFLRIDGNMPLFVPLDHVAGFYVKVN